MFCPQCGKQGIGGARYCAYCGAAVPPEADAPPSREPVAPLLETSVEAPADEIDAPSCGPESAIAPLSDAGSAYGPPQPGPYFVPPGQHRSGPPAGPEPPRNKFSIAWPISLTVLCCNLIFGILSIVFTAMGDSAAMRGSAGEAEDRYRTARILFWVGFGVSLATVIYIGASMIMGGPARPGNGGWFWNYLWGL